jgi:excisionase family DNA binding protein
LISSLVTDKLRTVPRPGQLSLELIETDVSGARRKTAAAAGRKSLPRLSVSPDEAATMLGVSRDYLDEHVLTDLRSVRRGRRILIAVSELERWLDRAAARRTL